MTQKSSKYSTKDVDERKEGIGQGELYSPYHAIKVNTDLGDNQQGNIMVGRGVANRMGIIKDRLMEKLTAASVPSDALDNAKHFLETLIKDVTSAAQGLTKDALQRIKSHLPDILPSLSPSLTSKMVDDAEKEAASSSGETGHVDDNKEGTDTNEKEEQPKGKVYASPSSSLYSSKL